MPVHDKISGLTGYVAATNTKAAKYLAPVLRVAHANTKPKMDTALLAVMCHVRSLSRPDDRPTRTDATPARIYGGHVSTSVTVREKPSVPISVGRKMRKLLVAVCRCCAAIKAQTRRSARHSRRPLRRFTSSFRPTVSAAMRSAASFFWTGESHHVVAGLLGKKKSPARLKKRLQAPMIRYIQRQPDRPRAPPSSL